MLMMVGALLLFSCRDYLDVVPKGYVIPSSVKEYELLLIGGDNGPNFTANADVLHFTNDNFFLASTEIGNINNILNTNFALYSWSDYRYADPTVSATAWNDAYRNIYTFNKIIEEIDGAALAAGDTEELRQRVKAQAYFGRAYEYLLLVNTFAKQYKEGSAASDPGVPLVLKADVTQILPSRGTVSAVYDQILQDLDIAVAKLPAESSIDLLPTLGAGYALLARTHLYKNDYAKAKEFAEKALAQRSDLVDYTDPGFSNFTLSMKNMEQYVIHYMPQPGNGYLSDDALALFPEDGTVDKRLTEQFLENIITENDEFIGIQYKMGTYDYLHKGTNSVSIPEMYVTLAECEARLGNTGAAISYLNTLRNNRIEDNVELGPADFASQNELIAFTLDERRREMLYSNTRLFDLKRQNLDPTFAKESLHKITGKNPMTFTAAPNSGKLVLPIPAQVLKFNPDMPQN